MSDLGSGYRSSIDYSVVGDETTLHSLVIERRLTDQEIAAMANCSVATVVNWRLLFGISRRRLRRGLPLAAPPRRFCRLCEIGSDELDDEGICPDCRDQARGVFHWYPIEPLPAASMTGRLRYWG